MKKLLFIFCTLLIAGCSGTSGSATGAGPSGAGPIELPAPIVGRITPETPDASGKATITGAPGAVTGNAIVLAINPALESTALLRKLSDLMIPSAYAQVFPGVCTEAGHVCTLSAADGSFELQITASIGDTIILVLVDPTGNEISPRISVVIPSTNLELQLGECATAGVVGALKDMTNIDGIPIALKDGNAQENNRLLVGQTTIPLPGCSAQKLVVTPPGTDDGSIVALLENGTLWSARWDGISSLYAATEATISEDIKAMAPMGDPNYVVAAIRTTSAGFAVVRLALATGGTDNALPIPVPALHTNEEIVALDTMGPFANNGYLGVVVVRAEGGGVSDYYATFFDTVNFTNSNTSDVPLVMNTSSIIVPTTNAITDVKFAIDDDDNAYRDIHLLFTDPQNRMFRALTVINNVAPPAKFRVATDVTQLNDLGLTFTALFNHTPNDPQLVPKAFSVGYEKGNPVAYTLVDDPSSTYNLWILADMIDPAGLPPQASTEQTIPNAVDPTSISVNGDTKTVFVGDTGSNSIIEANSLWLSDVL